MGHMPVNYTGVLKCLLIISELNLLFPTKCQQFSYRRNFLQLLFTTKGFKGPFQRILYVYEYLT